MRLWSRILNIWTLAAWSCFGEKRSWRRRFSEVKRAVMPTTLNWLVFGVRLRP